MYLLYENLNIDSNFVAISIIDNETGEITKHVVIQLDDFYYDPIHAFQFDDLDCLDICHTYKIRTVISYELTMLMATRFYTRGFE